MSHPMNPETGNLRGWTEFPDPQTRLDARGRSLVDAIKRLAHVDGRVHDPGKQLAGMVTGFCASGDVPNYLYHSHSRGIYAKQIEQPDEPDDALLATITMRGELSDMRQQHENSLSPARKCDVVWERGEVLDQRARFATNWWAA